MKALHRKQAEGLITQGQSYEARAESQRGKQRVFTLIVAYGEFQKAAMEALNADAPGMVEWARASSLRVMRTIEPLLSKRKRKKQRGRSIVP